MSLFRRGFVNTKRLQAANKLLSFSSQHGLQEDVGIGIGIVDEEGLGQGEPLGKGFGTRVNAHPERVGEAVEGRNADHGSHCWNNRLKSGQSGRFRKSGLFGKGGQFGKSGSFGEKVVNLVRVVYLEGKWFIWSKWLSL